MKYLFFLGKNPDLSELELFSLFKKLEISYRIEFAEFKFLIIEIDNDNFDPQDFISKAGGLVRIVKIISELKYFSADVFQELDIYYPENFNYSFLEMNLSKDESNDLKDTLKRFFKSIKVKAQLKSSEYSTKDSITDPQKFYSWKLDQGVELFCANLDGTYYYGQTEACPDPKVYIHLDEARPSKFFTHGTSFRLAQIMINILGLKEGDKLVDPFCGTGTFLIEGMKQGYNTLGIDIDKELITSSKKNIEWAKREFDLTTKYLLVHDSSDKAEFEATGSAFEPYMGPFLKTLPSFGEAQKIVELLDKVYASLFKHLYKRLERREGWPAIVCILPEFQLKDGTAISPNYKAIIGNARFRIMDLKEIDFNLNMRNPVLYQTPEGNTIVRKIYVLEKL